MQNLTVIVGEAIAVLFDSCKQKWVVPLLLVKTDILDWQKLEKEPENY